MCNYDDYELGGAEVMQLMYSDCLMVDCLTCLCLVESQVQYPCNCHSQVSIVLCCVVVKHATTIQCVECARQPNLAIQHLPCVHLDCSDLESSSTDSNNIAI